MKGGIAQSQIFSLLFGLWAFRVSYFPLFDSDFWLLCQPNRVYTDSQIVTSEMSYLDLAQQRCYGTLLIVTLLKE